MPLDATMARREGVDVPGAWGVIGAGGRIAVAIDNWKLQPQCACLTTPIAFISSPFTIILVHASALPCWAVAMNASKSGCGSWISYARREHAHSKM